MLEIIFERLQKLEQAMSTVADIPAKIALIAEDVAAVKTYIASLQGGALPQADLDNIVAGLETIHEGLVALVPASTTSAATASSTTVEPVTPPAAGA